MAPRYVEEQRLKQQLAKKTYQEGPTPAGGETLDASRFGAHNISEAVELFVRRVEVK